MNAYQLYLFVHVAAAVVWLGTAALQVVLGIRVVRAAEPGQTLAFARDAHWSGKHLYLPSNLLVLASGLVLVHFGGWSFQTLWIDLGLTGYAISLVTGATLLGPGWAKAAKVGGLPDPNLLHFAVRRLVFITNVDLAVLTGVLYAMVVKPAASDVAELVVGVAAVVLVLLSSRGLLRTHTTAVVPVQVAHNAALSEADR